MPFTAASIKEAEALEEELSAGLMNSDDPEYEENASTFNSLSQAIDDHYKSLRTTDDAGKLTSQPETRLPPIAQGNPQSTDHAFHFEPTVKEVQTLLRAQPELAAQYGLERLLQPDTTPDMSMPSRGLDDRGMPGVNRQSGATYLDKLTSNDKGYGKLADHIWEQRRNEAQASGKNLKRYKDIHLRRGQGVDWLKGGVEYLAGRTAGPLAMGTADTASMGTAPALYDMARDRLAEEPTEDSWTGEIADLARSFSADLPSSTELQERSPGAYFAGNMLGYALPGNPTNLIQGGLAKLGKYGAADVAGKPLRGVLSKALIAATSGGVANTAEGGVRDFSRVLADGGSIKEAGSAAVENMPGNYGTAFVLGGGADLIGRGAKSFHENRRAALSPMKTLHEAGGDSRIFAGYTAPEEIKERVRAANMAGARGSPGDNAAQPLAEKIQKATIAERTAEEELIGQQMEEYYNHPDYKDIKVSSRPLVNALLEMAREGRFETPVSKVESNFNPDVISTIRDELRAKWAEPEFVPTKDAHIFAAEKGGEVVSLSMAQDIFGEGAKYPGNFSAVIISKPVAARDVTIMEKKIDRILKMHTANKAPADPVYERLNRAVKEDVRDQFPAFEDEAGNLVGPPVADAPFPQAVDTPRTPDNATAERLPGPVVIDEPSSVAPESQRGVGPGQPAVFDPFNPRARRGPQESYTPLEAMASPIDIRGTALDDAGVRPEGLLGIGPDPQIPLPANPFDPMARTAPMESTTPLQSMVPREVQGSYSEPGLIPPEAIPGPGPRRDRSVYDPDLRGQTNVTGGDYAPPQSIEPDMPPEPTDMAPPTPRMPSGVPRESRLPDEATPLSMMASEQPAPEMAPADSIPDEPMMSSPEMAETPQRSALASAVMSAAEGNKSGLADVSSVVKAMGGDVKAAHKAILAAERRGAIELRPEGGLNRLSKDELALTLPGPSKTRLSKIRVIDADLLDEAIAAPTNASDALKGFPSNQRVQLTEVRKKLGNMSREEQDKLLNEMQDNEELVLYRNDNTPEVTAADKAAAMDVAGYPRHIAYFTPKTSSANKAAKASDDVLSRGPPAASGEIQRAADLSEQQRMEEAKGHVDKVDERLGPMPSADKEKMLLDLISKKLGREVTREDLIRAGILSASIAASASDDENVQRAGVVGGMLSGMGGKGKARAREMEATLANGKKVKGFSAYRTRQHERLNALETSAERTGAGSDKAIIDRIMTYNQVKGNKIYDDALFEAAKKLGLENELQEAAATSVYADLKQRHFGGSGGGLWKRVTDTAVPRLDRILGVIGGVPRNPLAAGPDGIMAEMWRSAVENPTRNLLNTTAGRTGARHGDDFQRLYEQLFPDDKQKEKRP